MSNYIQKIPNVFINNSNFLSLGKNHLKSKKATQKYQEAHPLTGDSCAIPRNILVDLVRSLMCLGFSLFGEILVVPCDHNLWHLPCTPNYDFEKTTIIIFTEYKLKTKVQAKPFHFIMVTTPLPQLDYQFQENRAFRFFCLSLNLQILEQCLASGQSSVSICGMGEWMTTTEIHSLNVTLALNNKISIENLYVVSKLCTCKQFKFNHVNEWNWGGNYPKSNNHPHVLIKNFDFNNTFLLKKLKCKVGKQF